MSSNWTKPFELTHPLDGQQVEQIDKMLTKLFSSLPLHANRGGTGFGPGDIAVGDLIYGNVDGTTPILSMLAGVSVGSYLRSGGVLTAPLWSTVKLPNTAAVGDMWIASTLNNITALTIGAAGTIIRSNGTIPANTSFTIPNTFAQGDVIYASATNVLTALVKDANATRYLSNKGASNAPSWAQVTLTNGVTGILDVGNGGTGLGSYVAGDIIYADAAASFTRVAKGGNGTYLRSNGTAPFWSTLTIPNTAVQGDVFYASATSVMSGLAKDTNATRYLSNTGASNAPAWAQIALATGVSGDLPFANFVQASAASVLAGRGSAGGAGDFQEITLGSGLTMTGTVLSSSGGGTPGGSDTQVQFNDSSAFGGDAGLTYNKATDALTMGSGVLTLGQLVFPATQNSSANVNTLDDYEEGTFTPVLGGSGGTTGQSYSVQVGTYVKIGKQVHLQIRLVLTAKGTITGTLELQGFPFTSSSATASVNGGPWAFFRALGTNYDFIGGIIETNNTIASVSGMVSGALGVTSLTTAAITDTTDMVASLTYQAAS